MKQFFTKVLLAIGSIFFLFEAVIHGFGLPILEHDKIFLPTHDRYIALFALTYAMLLFLITTDLEKYKILFRITMIGVLLAMVNAVWITYHGGYASFGVVNLDQKLSWLGVLVWMCYPVTLLSYYLKK